MPNECRGSPVSGARRRLIAAGAAWPLLAFTADACAQTKPPAVIGWLQISAREPNIKRVSAFHEGMAALGWKAGTHYVLEEHWGEGRRERMPALVQALAALKPAIIVAAPGGIATMAAKAAPATPIVYFGSDALASGLVKSLARPGGMITGVSNVNTEINAKLIELLLEAMPRLRRAGFFADPSGPSVPGMGIVLVIRKEITGRCDDNRREPQGGRREARLKEGGIKDTTVRTGTSSEASCGR